MAQGDGRGVLLLDHLVLPHNVYRLPRYLDENELKVIIVDRDPRDVYIDIRRRQEMFRIAPPIPMKPEDYVRFWKDLRESERIVQLPKQVLRIQYEDLFYNYDETISVIEKFCGFTPEQHIKPCRFFNPSLPNAYLYQFKTEKK